MRANQEATQPLSAASVKRYSTVFRSVMAEAYRQGLLPDANWQRGYVSYPKATHVPVRPYSLDEAKRFFRGLKDEDCMHRLMLLTSLLLGIRCGELVALKWSDFDLEANCVTITKSAYKVHGEPQALKDPKSPSSVRVIFFGDTYVSALLDWRKQQSRLRLKAPNWSEQDFVFTNATGNMINVDTPSKYCRKYEKRIGLRPLKLHGLRTTCASLLMNLGVDDVTIKELLGHESLETTKLYLEGYNPTKKEAALTLERALMEQKQNAISNTKELCQTL